MRVSGSFIFLRKDFTQKKKRKTQISDFPSDVFIKSTKLHKSTKRRTSDFFLLRCFLCA